MTSDVQPAEATSPPVPHLEIFARTLFEEGDIVEIRELPSGRSAWFQAKELGSQAERLRVANEAGQNVYVGINPRCCRGDGTKAQDCSGSQCGKCDSCVTHCQVLVADFDNTDVANANARIASASLPPATLVLNSGHGVHVYWRLNEPMADQRGWRSLQRAIAKLVGSDGSVSNPSRLMRLPGFTNHKKPIALCSLINVEDSRRYPLAEFAGLVPKAPGSSNGGPHDLARSADLNEIARAAKYLNAIPGAIEGNKGDEVTYRVACNLMRDFGLSKDEAMPLFRVWNRSCKPPWTETGLMIKLDHAAKYGKNAIGAKTEAGVLTQQVDGHVGRTAGQNREPRLTASPSVESAGQDAAEPLYDDWTRAREIGEDDLLFPLDAVPTVLRPYIQQAAETISCPLDYVGVPLLVALGSAIGRTRCIEVRDDWREYASLYAMVIGDSGTAKTPALREALLPILQLPDDHGSAWINDTTVEALAQLMQEKSRGITLYRDELSAWVRSFGQYRKGAGGSDEAFFLEAWSGAPVKINRKVNQRDDLSFKRFAVPRPFLSIIGGIQPTVLSALITPERIENGFAARFLLAYPQRTQRKFTFDAVRPDDRGAVRKVFAELLVLQCSAHPEPLPVRLGREAKEAWLGWIEAHNREISSIPDSSTCLPAWAKMESQALRLMLIIHMVRQAESGLASQEVDARTVEMAAKLIQYFKSHSLRVYAKAVGVSAGLGRNGSRSGQTVAPRADEAVEERVINWIRRRGNRGVQPRDIVSARIVPDATEATAILDSLLMKGIGTADGKTRRFFLTEDHQAPRGVMVEAA